MIQNNKIKVKTTKSVKSLGQSEKHCDKLNIPTDEVNILTDKNEHHSDKKNILTLIKCILLEYKRESKI